MDTDDPTFGTPAVLRLDDPVELLAYLPYRLGFWPTESAVFFSLRAGPTGQLRPGLVARVDLHDVGAEQGEPLRRELIEHLRADQAAVTFLVLYTATPFADVARGQTPAGRTLTWWLQHRGIADPSRAWVVGASRYRCLECAVQPCCPAQGHPLHRLQSSTIAAEMIYHGMSYAPNREGVLPVPQTDPAGRQAVVQAAGRLRRRRIVHGARRERWLTELTRCWDGYLLTSGPQAIDNAPPADLAALIVGLEEVAVRDAVLVAIATGIRVARARGPAGGEMLDRVFSRHGPRPDRQRVQRATDLLVHLAALAARKRAAPIWAVLAWISWFEGNGARADLCLERCVSQDPGHRLAVLIRRAVDHGIPPGWARVEAAA